MIKRFKDEDFYGIGPSTVDTYLVTTNIFLKRNNFTVSIYTYIHQNLNVIDLSD